jgi:hypothetical protein
LLTPEIRKSVAFCSYFLLYSCEAQRMTNSSETWGLRNRVAEAQHDVESIEIHIARQDEASITPQQVECLRGLQEMYRNRIVGLEATISELSDEETATNAHVKSKVSI